MGVPVLSPLPLSPAPQPNMSPSLQPVLEEQHMQNVGGTPAGPQRHPTGQVTRRRRLPRTPRPPVHHNLVQALNDNSRLLWESIIQAAEILDAAIRSSGVPCMLHMPKTEIMRMKPDGFLLHYFVSELSTPTNRYCH